MQRILDLALPRSRFRYTHDRAVTGRDVGPAAVPSGQLSHARAMDTERRDSPGDVPESVRGYR